jgi:signal transduction histidine kinase
MNAAQHSPEGSDIRLALVGPEEGFLRVLVTDRGTGIRPDALPRAFDPFFTTRKGGVGLGLSVAKRIVEGHGGSVAIRNNEPGPGCTVEVRLPAAE